MPVDWEEIKKEAFHRNPLIHPSWMMRKSWFELVGGYDPSFLASQDWELLLRRVWKDRIENIPEVLIKLRIHSGSVSFSQNRLQVYSGLKARLSAILRGDVQWYKAIYLIPSSLALIIPSKIKLFFRKYFIRECRSATSNEKILGIVMPVGQNKDQLLKSGQWNLWQSEIEEYQKHFDGVELFEYKHHDWRRFLEAMFLPFVQPDRFRRCSVLKAVHLSAAIPCLVAKVLYDIPYVLSFGYRYDEFAKIEKKWMQWIFIKFLEPVAVRFADLVLVPTEELGRYVKGLGARNIEVIPNGVDINLFKPAPKLRLTINDSRLTILFVGRLEKQKNLKTLIQAVSRIFKGPALIKLSFVGAGSQKDELVNLANKLEVNLEIVERIPNEKLPEIYHRADIFVLPSLAEGHPKVLLEAMSCGLACMASNIPGINGIIVDGKNGLLVKPTEDGLEEGLKRLIGDSGLRQRLGMNARKTVLEKFDKNKLMEIELKLLL